MNTSEGDVLLITARSGQERGKKKNSDKTSKKNRRTVAGNLIKKNLRPEKI